MNALQLLLAIIFAIAASSNWTAIADSQPHVETMRKKANEPIVLEVGTVKFTQTDLDRFWRRVSPKNELGCMLWLGSVYDDGYGAYEVSGKSRRAHIISWEIANGAPASPLQVQHICNKRSCVNPDHLILGTHQQNMAWRKVCGTAAFGDKNGSKKYPERLAFGDKNWTRRFPERVPRGEQSPRSKLTDDKVRKIRQMASDGATFVAIASEMGIAENTVSHVVNRRTWKHVI